MKPSSEPEPTDSTLGRTAAARPTATARAAGLLVALGVVYGDLGTSPMYAFRSIMLGQGGTMGETETLGALSLLFWFVTLIVTVKYVLVAMRADNHGEGGTFALYAAVHRFGPALAIVAMVGGAAFLADSVFTPAVSITSAIEGIGSLPGVAASGVWSQQVVVMVVLGIVAVLFLAQRGGTERLGRFFGPVMLVWFCFIGGIGVANIAGDPSVLRAIDPVRGIAFLLSSENKAGLAIMGSVFLALTGAEALYSDMGHVGRTNIRITWPFVFACLMLNYFGQGAWALAGHTIAAADPSPFFQMMPDAARPIGVLLAAGAGVIASQALISGAYTLVAAADGLGWLPRLRIQYPGRTRGQMCIPTVTAALWALCSFVVVFFGTSARMESAYGLALVVAMMMDSTMLGVFIARVQGRPRTGMAVGGCFLAVEALFLFASASKFVEGGWLAFLLLALVFATFYICREGARLEVMRRAKVTFDRAAEIIEQAAPLPLAPQSAAGTRALAGAAAGAVEGEAGAACAAERFASGTDVAGEAFAEAAASQDACAALGTETGGDCAGATVRLPRVASAPVAPGARFYDHLVYLTPDISLGKIERDVLSHMRQNPARTYWVVSVAQSDRPFECSARVRVSKNRRLYRIKLTLGWRMPHYRLQSYVRDIMKHLINTGVLARTTPRWPDVATPDERHGIGLVRYVLMHRVMSVESRLPDADRTLLRAYQLLKRALSHPVAWFGLETADPIIATVALWRGGEEPVEVTMQDVEVREVDAQEDREAAATVDTIDVRG